MIVKKADMTVQPRLAWRGGEGAPVCYHLEKDVPAASGRNVLVLG